MGLSMNELFHQLTDPPIAQTVRGGRPQKAK